MTGVICLLLHDEDFVFEFLGKFAALIDAEVTTLLGGSAIGPALGHFREICTIVQEFVDVVGFLLNVGDFRGSLAFGFEFDGAESDLFGADKLRFVLFVIFFGIFIADGDVRTDFPADNELGESVVADIGFEFVPIHALGGDSLFEIVHVRQLVLDADLVELLDDVGFDADAQIFTALSEQRLIDQAAKGVFLARLQWPSGADPGVQRLEHSWRASSSAEERAFSSSDLVIISLLTRAMISSTVFPSPVCTGLLTAGVSAS